jgi:ABC-type branched-subunit amino acid transport system ATPase component
MGTLVARGIVAGYGAADEVLKGVELEVATGEIVCVIGPNGAGKSTLLKAIAGLLRPSRGRVELDGVDITGWAARDISRRGLAYVPQEHNIFPTMTVRENLEMGGYVDPKGAAAHIERVFSRFPVLAQKRRHAARTLSGGERQMLALGSAIMCRPELLLVDELSLGLAPVVVEDLLRRLAEIRRELAITILIVEQSATVALEIADYGYVMENGRVVLDGDRERLRSHQDVQEFYLGQASGERRSYRAVKQYRRSRRWYG